MQLFVVVSVLLLWLCIRRRSRSSRTQRSTWLFCRSTRLGRFSIDL